MLNRVRWIRGALLAIVLAAGAAAAASENPPPPSKQSASATSSQAAKGSPTRYTPDRFAGRAGTYYLQVWGIDSLGV